MSRVATVNHSTSRLALFLPHPVTFMSRTVTVSTRYIGSRPMERCSTRGAKREHYRDSLPFPIMFLRTEKAGCWSLTERRIIGSKFLTLMEVSFLSGQDALVLVDYTLTRTIPFILPKAVVSASLTAMESCLPAGMFWAVRTMRPTVPTASG